MHSERHPVHAVPAIAHELAGDVEREDVFVGPSRLDRPGRPRSTERPCNAPRRRAEAAAEVEHTKRSFSPPSELACSDQLAHGRGGLGDIARERETETGGD